MSSKKKLIITLLVIIIPIIVCCIGMVIVDPYFHFHKPIKGIPYTLEEDTYINAGVLKNFDYDSVIVGSSLASLMEPSIPDNRIGTKTVLVTLRGASTKNGTYLMEYALNKNSNIKNIYYSLDYGAVTGDKDDISRELPDYLYDANPLNDTQYILNKDIWIDGVYTLFDKNRPTPIITDFDKAYGFDAYVQYSRASVLSKISEDYFGGVVNFDFPNYSSRTEYIDNIKNIEPDSNVIGNITCNIEPLLGSHPDVQFYFYMAPMPILSWYSRIKADGVEAIYQLSSNLYYIFSELAKYDNCHLFFFYDDDVMFDLYRFCDTIHWDRNVGRYIMNSMLDGNRVVTSDNKGDYVYNLYKKVSSFDYNVYNYQRYPFQNITNFEEFLNEIGGERYMKIVLLNGEEQSDKIRLLAEKGFVTEKCFGGKYYYAVICGDKIVYEKVSTEPFEDTYKLGGEELRVVSKNHASEASIMIGSGEYCPEEEPIDIVVVDLQNNMIVDSVGLNVESGEWNQY